MLQGNITVARSFEQFQNFGTVNLLLEGLPIYFQAVLSADEEIKLEHLDEEDESLSEVTASEKFEISSLELSSNDFALPHVQFSYSPGKVEMQVPISSDRKKWINFKHVNYETLFPGMSNSTFIELILYGKEQFRIDLRFSDPKIRRPLCDGEHFGVWECTTPVFSESLERILSLFSLSSVGFCIA